MTNVIITFSGVGMNKDDNMHANDDTELAKVLEGINGQGASPTLPAPDPNGLQFEETPTNNAGGSHGDNAAPDDNDSLPESDIPNVEVIADEPVYRTLDPAPSTTGSPLEAIKKSALEELRPLVDKLDLPADEKFDTLLLIIRSTDDQSLVNATYEAAKLISDENKRAQALLDVIKEIDYFANQANHPNQPK